MRDAMVGVIVLAAGVTAALLCHAWRPLPAVFAWKGIDRPAQAVHRAELGRPIPLEPSPALSPEEVVAAVLTITDSQPESFGRDRREVLEGFLTVQARETMTAGRPGQEGPGLPPALGGHLGHSRDPMQVVGDVAHQTVRTQSIDSGIGAFEFVLRKQEDGLREGCWLIDKIVSRPDLVPPNLSWRNVQAPRDR